MIRDYRLMVLALLAGQAVHAQICRVSVAGLNRNRQVFGAVNVECPPSIHTAPFGNWGVTSNFGSKVNGHQFQGWCSNVRVCDNRGSCWTDCRDGWYEWNSCTGNSLYSAPNCTLYNAGDCDRQVTTTGINVHGTRITDVAVRCPMDTNGDGISDNGGCGDAAVYRSGTNFMSLYELDPGTTDELVQTIYFPEVVMQLGCDVWGCAPQGSDWLTPLFYDSPPQPARVSAEFAALVNYGVFIDNNRNCRAVAPSPSAVSGASYLAPVAPDSIVTLLGRGLATSPASATTSSLPAELAGTRVSVTDSAGVSRSAGLYYVSMDQVNLILPPGTATGSARLTITRADTVTASGNVMVANTAPAIFSANASGTGAAAATAVRVGVGGTQTPIAVFRCDGGPGSCVPEPIDFGSSSDRLFVSLYGTGIRRAPNSVSAFVANLPAQVHYAGPQSQYPGLDQVNIEVPNALRGQGVLEVRLEQLGARSNSVQIALQ